MRANRNIFKTALVALSVIFGCSEEEVPQTAYKKVSGEYDAVFELTQPITANQRSHFRIYNVSSGADSLWIDDEEFFESKVKVKWDGPNTFSVIEGVDLYHGEIVNITGELYAGDSIRVEWRYLQMTGDPADDYVVVANGLRYTGLD